MNKKVIMLFTLLFTLIILAFQLCGLNNKSTNVYANDKRIGLTLDCSRIYYSTDKIKQYINLLSKNKATYLQLHLNDNENFGIENETLNQTTDNATKKGNVYYNKKTKLPFLSKDQLLDIIQYGYEKGIQVVPEIDVPGHAQSIFKLLSYTKNGKKLVKEIRNPDGYNEMFYNRKATIDLSKKLLSEYVGMLPKGYYLGVGADEITISDKQDQKAAVKYINTMDDYVNSKSLKMEMWNDSFHKAVLNQYHKNILINYWSLSGDVSDTKDYNDNVRLRATLPQLNSSGFKTINYNSYYLYIITDPLSFTKDSIKDWKDDFDKWKMGMWNDESRSQIAKSKNNIGTSLSIWGEYPNKYDGDSAYKNTNYFVKYFLKKARSY
ncbi:family 20 glycosylhydrolase [Apilactobacillus apisilvae]|uniref:beta-N-acetylhexosaminidase n=1 Tax=Apilactobacillus apisilvae TaxID=2923364 RepID=A0ABY4PJJ1_9LACO|nr:family 20 glycosylhydrolase [Apilactobacillus apisilvae]UQS85497.1 family 20 glycosylhydrolase [Apilactobacillus apisilvae]